MVESRRSGSGIRAAALFVLFAGATGAGIVAADFGTTADNLLHWCAVAGTGHAGLFKFATLTALEGFFEIVHRSCNLSRWTADLAKGNVAARTSNRSSCWTGWSLVGRPAKTRADSCAADFSSLAHVTTLDDLHKIQIPDS